VSWYISDFGRWKAEREALDRLGIEAEWFVPVRWHIDDEVRLVLDADISAAGRTWPVFLRFPEFFPNTPPSVFPRGDKSRWSSHQYGPGGELCLEYGPDNWIPDLTGVHVMESAHRLIEGENPASGEQGQVPSRHLDTPGQQFRLEYGRLLVTREAQEAFAVIPPETAVVGTMISAHHKEATVYVFRQMATSDGTTWTDKGVPPELAEEFFEQQVPIFRIEANAALPDQSTLAAFRAACASFGFAADQRYALILHGSEAHLYLLWDSDNSVLHIAAIPPQYGRQRLDTAHAVLRDKNVALVGCGSLGGKIGAMLARSGLGKILLVDDDLLLPDNFVRNELDWRDAGAHKAQALARRLQLVNPSIETTIWRTRIASQSSAASAEAILSMLGERDLIIDATANPDVLNIISVVATAKSKPVVWAEVFGGGIGGLIARFRPGLEPQPQYIRRAIENWFCEQDAPPVGVSRSYETGGEGGPLIADDADVSAIAAHAARFAIDLLIRDTSLFPNSVYAIGLAVGSVFTQPFDTRPIDVGPRPAEPTRQQLSEQETAAEVERIIELFKARADEVAAAPQNNQAPQAQAPRTLA
jgi:molybdopterin/thiamine biosynthesis adenylyltransferase